MNKTDTGYIAANQYLPADKGWNETTAQEFEDFVAAKNKLIDSLEERLEAAEAIICSIAILSRDVEDYYKLPEIEL